MTKLIHHRANTLEASRVISRDYGAEIDLRLHHGGLVLAHEPLEKGCDFGSWLSTYHGSLLVINVKEMGLEELIVDEITRINSHIDYFFLDQSIPYMIKSIANGYECAARISEYETVESAYLQNTTWLWVDSFTGNWDHLVELSIQQEKISRRRKVCLVSPELQGRNFKDSNEANMLVNQIRRLRLELDAICTKFASAWEEMLA